MNKELVIVQWEFNFGGLEKISKIYEDKFYAFNPLIAVLRPTKLGFEYKNSFVFKSKNNFKFILQYFHFIKQRNKNLFHLQYTGAAILFLTYLAGARKIIYHFHGTKFPNDIFTRLTWKLLHNKVTVIANSRYTANVVAKKLNLDKIDILPNLIDIQRFEFKERTYSEGKFIVSFVGRFDRGKNVQLIIETANCMKQMDSNIYFLIVGDGPEKKNIENKISAYNIANMINLKPYTKDILEVYYSSNLLFFPSLYESFGNVVAEAILTGLPVLCYKIPALEELVSDEIFFYESNNPVLISKKILEMKQHYGMINQKLLRINDHLREYLNEEKIIDKLKNIYTNI